MNTKTGSESSRGFAVMKDLTSQGRNNDASSTFKNLGELLASSRLRGTIQVWLVPDDSTKPSCYRVTFGSRKYNVSSTSIKKPNVELLMKPAVWSQISAGKLAPIEAFVTGQMRVRGDFILAQKIMKHTADSSGRTNICLGGE